MLLYLNLLIIILGAHSHYVMPSTTEEPCCHSFVTQIVSYSRYTSILKCIISDQKMFIYGWTYDKRNTLPNG